MKQGVGYRLIVLDMTRSSPCNGESATQSKVESKLGQHSSHRDPTVSHTTPLTAKHRLTTIDIGIISTIQS